MINILLYQSLSSNEYEKILKSHTKTFCLKDLRQRKMINLNYLMHHILYQIYKINLSISSKKHETITNNLPIRKYIKETGNGRSSYI